MRKLKIITWLFVVLLAFAVAFTGTFALLSTYFAPSAPVLALAGEDVDGGESEYAESPESDEEPEEEVLQEVVHTEPATAPTPTPTPAPGIDASTFVVDNDLLPWNLTLVNRYNALDAEFSLYLAPIGGGHYFDARAAHSLLAMISSARSQGLSPIVASAHRSISRQTTLFNNQLNRRLDEGLSFYDAFDAARRVVAYPGTSEHNLGLAVDIVAYSYRYLTAAFGQTAEGQWLAQNSHRYGFILRYPYHKQHITNIIYEPWHFRYVGVIHATTMFERDLVLEEYVVEYLGLN